MTFSLTDVDARTALLRGFEGVDVSSLPRPQLLALLRIVGEVKCACDRLAAEVAGEVARRSTVDDGPGGLARQQGFASAEQLVSSVLGSAPADGFKLVRAGKALSQQGAVGGAMRCNALSVDKADLISRTLEPLAGDTGELAGRLIRAASHLDYRKLALVCRTEAARFDAAQTQNRERRQHERRSLEFTEDAFGMTHLTGQLDPVSAAIVKTYFDAQVKNGFQARRDSDEGGLPVDSRTASQIRADALVALAAHGLDCDSPAAGVKATIIMRVNADDLAGNNDKDTGLATCDTLTTPISLTALRELAMDATILRMVVDAKSHVLDMGREQRLFSWAQRMALAERDGGCAKCHAPISHCIAHHIRWWQRDSGPTAISNGVLLCVRCHTQVHRDGWGIHVDIDNHVWFTPPKTIDPNQHRILGGLAALTM